MSISMELTLGALEGRERLVAADRQLRQLRMLAPSARVHQELDAPQGEAASEIAAIARSLDIGVVRESRRNGDSVPEEWGRRGLRVSVVIACHNYGHYLAEAIDSVLAQTYLPDEILLSDDGSTDDSVETMMRYARKYPDLITVNVNGENLGIDQHFNKAIALTTGDAVMFLGADNRIPVHYVESCLSVLVDDRELAIAYTDFALFGSRATAVHDSLRESFRGSKLDYGVRLSRFPDFDAESRSILDSGLNFIHGSSMYRRDAYEAVGGYGSRSDGPEDMRLFQSMIVAGWGAKKVSGAYLEYRQHSADQANMQFSLYRELHALREDVIALRLEIDSLTEEIASRDRDAELQREERVLLQEDNERLRAFVDRVRSFAGYRVLAFLSTRLRRLRTRVRGASRL